MAGLSVLPDITLLSSGADPAAEVGQLTAPLLWVGENRREMWGGWRYGLAPVQHAEHWTDQGLYATRPFTQQSG